MLRRLALSDRVGSLEPLSLPTQVCFGQHTVVYGHNGSGKSTLAGLLGAIGSGHHPSTVTWHTPDGAGHQLRPGQQPPGVHVSAFTASWVRENLTSFLSGDGAGAHAILTLGSAAVDNAAEIDTEEHHRADLLREEGSLDAAARVSTTEMEALCARVQDEASSALHTVDRYFSRNRFDVRSVGRRLAEHAGRPNSDDEHDRFMEETQRSKLPQIEAPQPPFVSWAGLDERLRVVTSTTPTSRLLDDLAGSPQAQSWVQTGLELHATRDDCYFCDHTISAAHRTALDQHFDQSRAHVVKQVRDLRDEVSRLQNQQRQWLDALPSPELLYPETMQENADVFERSVARHDRALEYLEAADKLLAAKEATPETPDKGSRSEVPAGEMNDDLSTVISQHNRIASSHESRLRAACEAALDSMIGRRAVAYQALNTEQMARKHRLTTIRAGLKVIEGRLQDLRSRELTSSVTAQLLTQDLDRVYGKRHLEITVTADGKAYRCLRDGAPASGLSEGERQTLALLYFLRTLDDASTPVDASQRLVVVDDPSSSLDKEGIFGTHARLTECLDQYGQSIILTHDFELLRMLITSRKSRLNTSKAKIKRGNEEEEKYPGVRFLEITARPSGSVRTSHLAGLSEVVLGHPSEYHFLFEQIVHGLENPTNHDILFLLPNAARRLLETFVSFRVPDRPDHRKRLEKLCAENEGAVFREVYDFCNRFSHGEDRHVAEPLDEAVVLREIRRCLDFIHAVDPGHFDAMLRSTGRSDEATILLPKEISVDNMAETAASPTGGASNP